MSEPSPELSARAAARIGTVVRGKYRLERVLGIGGMGTVYEARHRNRARLAVKILHPELATLESVRKRFHREAYAANAIGHRGVVRVVDDDVTEDGAAFLVMDLLEGLSVEAIARRHAGKVLPVPIACAILLETLDALGAAHARRIIHRDIKPANLFVATDGVVKVLDFGIARALDEGDGGVHLTSSGVPIGTPAFMAPEQALARSAEIDARTDVWAAGATLFTLLAGQTVHPDETMAGLLVMAATTAARPLAAVASDAPAPIAAVVDRALAFERDRRWASALEMKSALEEALSKSGLAPATKDELAAIGQGGPDSRAARPDPFAPTEGRPEYPSDRTSLAGSGGHDHDTEMATPSPSMRSTTSARGAPPAARSTRGKAWRLAPIPSACVVVASLAFVHYRSRPGAQPAAPPAPPVSPTVPTRFPIPVLVPIFEARTIEPLFDSTLDRVLSTALMASEKLDPYGASRLAFALAEYGQSDVARLPAAMEKALGKRVVTLQSTAELVGRSFVFRVVMKDGDGSTIATASRTTTDLDHVIAAIALLAKDVRAALGDPPERPELAELGGLSPSLEADHEWTVGAGFTGIGRKDDALAHLHRALQIDPGFMVAHQAMGYAYYNVGDFAEATRQFELVNRSSELCRRLHLRNEGDYTSMIGRNDEAIAAFEDLHKTWPDDVVLAQDLSETFLLARQPKRALEVAEGDPSSATGFIAAANMAKYKLFAGDLVGARDVALKTFTDYPNGTDYPFVVLALATKLLDPTKDVTGLLPVGSRASPTSPADVAYLQADLALYDGKIDVAAQAMQRAEDLARTGKAIGTSEFIWALAAEVELAQGHRSLALAAAEQAARSSDPWPRYSAGVVFASTGQWKRADAMATAGLGPDAALVAKLVEAASLRERHKLDASLAALREARSIADAWVVHRDLAATYIAQGNSSAAKTELETCLARKGEGALSYIFEIPTLRYVALAEASLDNLAKTKPTRP